MREILFRGKSIDGQWNYGNLVHLICETGGEITTDVMKIHPIKINGADYPCKVIPETVGQYTGLTDKFGTKIFEGDIIRDQNGKQYAVVYEDRFYTAYFGIAISKIETWGFDDLLNADRFEVVGNIHDLLDAKMDEKEKNQ